MPKPSDDIGEVTERYEAWLAATLPCVVEADLEYKHEQMAAGVFPFLRATFYRWAQRWAEVCPHLVSAPPVLGVGDLHVENYGTWRDDEGRLVWGINDFDEATILPYTADLVRLATSATVAAAGHHLSSSPADAISALLSGYQEGLTRGGEPFVLAEGHGALRRLATGELREPARFWSKMRALPEAPRAQYPPEAVTAVVGALPGPGDDADVRSRRAGLGSLGRPRLVALAQHRGGLVAREVKALLPSAWDWAAGASARAPRYTEVIRRSVRDEDPRTSVNGDWLVRRLAPDCARIELADLPAERDETVLLHSMGFELANIHLGSPEQVAAILDDLADRSRRHGEWLVAMADRMAADTENDWNAWRRRL